MFCLSGNYSIPHGQTIHHDFTNSYLENLHGQGNDTPPCPREAARACSLFLSYLRTGPDFKSRRCAVCLQALRLLLLVGVYSIIGKPRITPSPHTLAIVRGGLSILLGSVLTPQLIHPLNFGVFLLFYPVLQAQSHVAFL